MGEPAITAFTTGNIIETRLIAAASDAVRKILARNEFEWGLKRTTLVTTDDITTDSAAVTKDSATVTSVDSDGANANSFTGATTSMWFRATTDATSYEITSIAGLSDTPDTITIDPSYKGTTSTSLGYRIFQDTFALSDSDLDEVRYMAYGEAPLSKTGQRDMIGMVNLSDIFDRSGGDLHRDVSGRPRLAAKISVDSSDNPRYVLWPFPTDDYVITVWYTVQYSENSTFATNMFSGDAPEIAYDAVSHYVNSAAYRWDKNFNEAAIERQDYTLCLAELMKRENDFSISNSMSIDTSRRSNNSRWPVSRGILFDTKSSFSR